jgi:GNAT superfamily N-acetyltransferase
MWSQYNAFYETAIPEAVTRTTWERLIEARSMHGLIAEEAGSGALLGFANYVIHPYTWSERQACYLEDLFVRPAARGRGVGRALIEWLGGLALQHGFDRLYWMTREGNAAARRLYDRLGERDDFIRYEMKLANGSLIDGKDTKRQL